MHYYEVLVGALAYHGSEALTYCHDKPLPAGSVVKVPLRNQAVLGIIVREVDEPEFAVKPIASVADLPPVPPESLQLMEWLGAYYPAPLGAVVRQFVPPTTA